MSDNKNEPREKNHSHEDRDESWAEELLEHTEDLVEDIAEDIVDLFSDDEFIEQNKKHRTIAQTILYVRNTAVVIAVALFIASLFVHSCAHDLRAMGYVFGAICYFLELVEATNFFKNTEPDPKHFMIYCFGPLYVLMAISYFLE